MHSHGLSHFLVRFHCCKSVFSLCTLSVACPSVRAWLFSYAARVRTSKTSGTGTTWPYGSKIPGATATIAGRVSKSASTPKAIIVPARENGRWEGQNRYILNVYVCIHMAVGQHQWYHFGVGRCTGTIHFSLFLRGLGCSLELRGLDP